MTQSHVEQVLGRLLTDEALRRRFAADPAGTVGELVAAGAHLNPCERRALEGLDPVTLAAFADHLHPSIQKIDIRGAHP